MHMRSLDLPVRSKMYSICTFGGEMAPSFGSGQKRELAFRADESHALLPDDFAILVWDVLPNLSIVKLTTIFVGFELAVGG